jgi:glucose-1-phosphate thymidylyltransferase
MDCGTPDSLNDASNFIRAIESRQNLKIGCIEEIAWLNKWITSQDLEILASKMGNNSYSSYLKRIILR